jgi:uncharacterized protein with GYD domain
MPKYLIKVSYTAEGIKGLLSEGGSSRRAAVEELTKSLGGSLEAFYFAFGDNDLYLIAEVPDNATAATAALIVTATGTVRTETVVLLTPEEVDEATRKTAQFRPAGG